MSLETGLIKNILVSEIYFAYFGIPSKDYHFHIIKGSVAKEIGKHCSIASGNVPLNVMAL